LAPGLVAAFHLTSMAVGAVPTTARAVSTVAALSSVIKTD
jgi:hypothetical protein